MTEQVNKEAEQVNKEDEHVEMITKEPEAITPVLAKKKDPRKIEAGKKLAAYNKKAKKSKAELKDNSGDSSVDSEINQGGSGFDITLTTVVAIIGLGLTGVDLYLRHKKINEKGVDDYKMEMVKDGETLDPTFIENKKNKKKGVKTVRFEPGMV